MITFYGDWQKDEKIEFRCGEYARMDFFGPFCHFEVRRDGKCIRVIPILVRFEDAENAIGDFKLIKLMAKELFIEFGPFEMYIPKLNRDIEVDSEDVEPNLVKVLSEIKLI